MPRTDLTWRTHRPAEGFYSSVVQTPDALPVRTFLPTGYEPNYPYPLIVLLHGHGGNEDRVLRMAPRLSRRNYICIALRGPRLIGTKSNGRRCYGWGRDGEHQDLIRDYLVRAVEQTRRTYHVHSERIYLAGVCEGATEAFRTAFAMPERVAGVIAFNGELPRGGPMFRLADVRHLRVLIAHGIANVAVPLTVARRNARLLYTAGIDVRMHTYATTHRMHPDMLRDANRWVMEQINAEI
jgi:phospholipase/carboxylesterase